MSPDVQPHVWVMVVVQVQDIRSQQEVSPIRDLDIYPTRGVEGTPTALYSFECIAIKMNDAARESIDAFLRKYCTLCCKGVSFDASESIPHLSRKNEAIRVRCTRKSCKQNLRTITRLSIKTVGSISKIRIGEPS